MYQIFHFFFFFTKRLNILISSSILNFFNNQSGVLGLVRFYSLYDKLVRSMKRNTIRILYISHTTTGESVFSRHHYALFSAI